MTPDYSTRQTQKEGILKKDEEIFDLTDSRLVNPPTENRQNAPLVEPEVTEPDLNNFQKIHNSKSFLSNDQEPFNQFQIPGSSASNYSNHIFSKPSYDKAAKAYINLGYEYLEKSKPYKSVHSDSTTYNNHNKEVNTFNSQEDNHGSVIVKSLPPRPTYYHDHYESPYFKSSAMSSYTNHFTHPLYGYSHTKPIKTTQPL